MKIEIRLEEGRTEPEVIILTGKMTEEINELVSRLSEKRPEVIAGFLGDTLEIIEPSAILRAYGGGQKVCVQTAGGEYTVRQRLYELEKRLEGKGFARISNSEIVNLKKVKSFDLSLSGTICVRLCDGTVTYVSRRYVSRIKELLGV